MSRVACRLPGCLLRVYFCQVTDKTSGAQPWRSVEFELGDWRGTGLGVNDRSGQPIPLNLNRYTIAITDANGTLATYNLTSNGCTTMGAQNPPCAHGWWSGWRAVFGAWPYRRSIASLVAANLLPVMSATAIPQSAQGGPGPFSYPPPPNHILGMRYGPGTTGTDDSMAGMMQGVHGMYCETEQAADLVTMMAVADSAHAFPIILRDLSTEALVDFWNSTWVPAPGGSEMPQYWTLLDVLLTNTTGATITVPNGNNNVVSFVADSGGQTYIIGNDQMPPNNPPIVIPPGASLAVTMTLHYAAEPTGTPSVYTRAPDGSHITYPGLTASYVPGSLSRGSGTGCDSSHNNPHSYLPFLVTGDPYYLTGLQGLAVNAGYCSCDPKHIRDGSGINYHVNGRGSSWTLRDVMQAEVATPANAPSWLVPKASLRRTVDAIEAGFTWASRRRPISIHLCRATMPCGRCSTLATICTRLTTTLGGRMTISIRRSQRRRGRIRGRDGR
jgi:hypothetical protein